MTLHVQITRHRACQIVEAKTIVYLNVTIWASFTATVSCNVARATMMMPIARMVSVKAIIAYRRRGVLLMMSAAVLMLRLNVGQEFASLLTGSCLLIPSVQPVVLKWPDWIVGIILYMDYHHLSYITTPKL
jgi:hypothetical protein